MLKVNLSESSILSYDGNTEVSLPEGGALSVWIYRDDDWLDASNFSFIILKNGYTVFAKSFLFTKNDDYTEIDVPATSIKDSGNYEIRIKSGLRIAKGFVFNITKTAAVMSLSDEGTKITIDKQKRLLNTELYMLGCTGDTNSEIVEFRFPRYADGVDLSKKHVRINYINADNDPNCYAVEDLQVADDSYIEFSWVISNHVTATHGEVEFAVLFFSMDSNSVYTYRWSTQSAKIKVYPTTESVIDDANYPYTAEVVKEVLEAINHNSIILKQLNEIDEQQRQLSNLIASHCTTKLYEKAGIDTSNVSGACEVGGLSELKINCEWTSMDYKIDENDPIGINNVKLMLNNVCIFDSSKINGFTYIPKSGLGTLRIRALKKGNSWETNGVLFDVRRNILDSATSEHFNSNSVVVFPHENALIFELSSDPECIMGIEAFKRIDE